MTRFGSVSRPVGGVTGAIERGERRRAALWAAPAVAWTAVFFVLPFLVMVALSLWRRDGDVLVAAWDLGNYATFLARPHFVAALVNSLEITALVTVISVLLAYPFALVLAFQVPQRWQRFALVVAVLPFWTSYVVRSYAWTLVLAREGVVNDALGWVGIGPLALASSRAATVIGFTHFFVMLLTLTIYANLRALPRNYARAARDLGAGPLQIFWFILLPLSLPGVMVGAFLTFTLCIGDYVTPQILGGNTELTLPQLIMLQLGRRADLPMAAALSVILMGVVTLAYLVCARWLRMAPR